jgi:seryl-tRNA synthetase
MLDLGAIEGFRWIPNGQSSFSGDLLALYQALDRMFLSWAAETGAAEHRFPTFIQASELEKLDYFRSFPHLVTFPAALSPEEGNLKAFVADHGRQGEIHPTKLQKICDCLTPAACYHFYITYQGQSFDRPKYLTTLATCYRRESHYLPLRRQWAFGMREIVCIGTSDEVKAFLERYRAKATDFFARIGLPIAWAQATDPFFDARSNPKYLAQKLDPVKHEMIYRDAALNPEDGLSIGSVNFHRNYFGEAFKLTRDGAEAYTGCIAFGMERWIYAILTRFGTDPSRWPVATELGSGASAIEGVRP